MRAVRAWEPLKIWRDWDMPPFVWRTALLSEMKFWQGQKVGAK